MKEMFNNVNRREEARRTVGNLDDVTLALPRLVQFAVVFDVQLVSNG